MATYQIRSKSVKKYRVTVGNCSKAHAQSVLRSLIAHPGVPSDLVLRRKFRG